MKKLKLIPLLAVVFMLNVASMCSSDDNSSSASTTTTQVQNAATSGTWHVTLYNEDGSVQTSDYSGYNFSFNSDGSLAAVKSGSTTQTGTWNTLSDSGSVKMNIGFTAPDGPFESISEDWRVLSASTSKIELKHTSGGDGSIDLLTFEKN